MLDEQMRLRERFDHNLHALRIVESFERRCTSFHKQISPSKCASS
ncbi:MAG: hypothetical protein R2724_23160 [Bryobacterales bacterium]